MRRFRDDLKQAAYEEALGMHERLMREQSAHATAYRRGYLGQSYNKTWASYPVYVADKDNRRKHGV
ncbi:hypothetical protein [Thioalkalivibrio thiocyanodenitrificans]|uniref:hypothetical protein n=1 Tax=Thioalkalivibrio thiocyanodenitrificans TaxID=243063 RepID=UPI000371362F|nr:hypothetical protein [Thioalkalivibrio thiocyanodenitrificans]